MPGWPRPRPAPSHPFPAEEAGGAVQDGGGRVVSVWAHQVPGEGWGRVAEGGPGGGEGGEKEPLRLHGPLPNRARAPPSRPGPAWPSRSRP